MIGCVCMDSNKEDSLFYNNSNDEFNDKKINNDYPKIPEEELIYKKLSVYTNNFSKEQLLAYEDEIYGPAIQGYHRVKLEYLDLLRKLSARPDKYAKYIDALDFISSRLKVAMFDPTVIIEISKEIVRIQLECDLKVSLYSAIPLLAEESGISKKLR